MVDEQEAAVKAKRAKPTRVYPAESDPRQANGTGSLERAKAVYGRLVAVADR